jgi:hypothetical protein
MNARSVLLVAATLFAGPAFGQPAAAPTTPTAPAAATPTASATAVAPGTKLEGVTVTGKRPLKGQCGEKDQACTLAVIAELKLRYPEQLKRWCNQVRDGAMWANIEQSALFPGNHPGLGGSFQPPAVTKLACATDKKP